MERDASFPVVSTQLARNAFSSSTGIASWVATTPAPGLPAALRARSVSATPYDHPATPAPPPLKAHNMGIRAQAGRQLARTTPICRRILRPARTSRGRPRPPCLALFGRGLGENYQERLIHGIFREVRF